MGNSSDWLFQGLEPARRRVLGAETGHVDLPRGNPLRQLDVDAAALGQAPA